MYQLATTVQGPDMVNKNVKLLLFTAAYQKTTKMEKIYETTKLLLFTAAYQKTTKMEKIYETSRKGNDLSESDT
ncbi:hypothetical protein QE152_g1971 [Popillia japonica]|uniref:Uncharacterized protein n=1 Tax=Popillia japonica TaxID=7064 RepID=A0AAW1N349_POPJA